MARVAVVGVVSRTGVERVADVVYSTVAGRDLQLDLYLPTVRPHDCPVSSKFTVADGSPVIDTSRRGR